MNPGMNKTGHVLVIALFLLLVASGVVVFLLLRDARKSEPERMNAIRDENSPIHRVAERLGVRTDAERSAEDVATDIRLFLDDAPFAPKECLSQDAVDRACRVLKPAERELLKKWWTLEKSLAGKQVLGVPQQ